MSKWESLKMAVKTILPEYIFWVFAVLTTLAAFTAFVFMLRAVLDEKKYWAGVAASALVAAVAGFIADVASAF